MLVTELPPPSGRDKAAIASWLKQVIASYLGTSVDMIDGEMPLMDFGLDSLFVIRTFAHLRQALDIEADPATLAVATSIDDLACRIEDAAAERTLAPVAKVQVWASFSPEPLADAIRNALDVAKRTAVVRCSQFADTPVAPVPMWTDGRCMLVAAIRLSDWGRRPNARLRGLMMQEWASAFTPSIVVLCPGSETEAARVEFKGALSGAADITMIDGSFVAPAMLDRARDLVGKVPYTDAGFRALAALVAADFPNGLG